MALITMGALVTGGILGPGTGQAATVTVDQKDFFFDPTTVTVDGGDTLTIANVSKTSPHTFTISRVRSKNFATSTPIAAAGARPKSESAE